GAGTNDLGHPELSKLRRVIRRVDDIVDRDSATGANHPDHFSNRLIPQPAVRNVVKGAHRNRGVKALTFEGEPLGTTFLDLDPFQDPFPARIFQGRLRTIPREILPLPDVYAHGLARGQ